MKTTMTPFKKGFLLIITYIMIQPVTVLADTYNIVDSGSAGGFSLISDFFQKTVNLMIGPFAKGTIAITLIGAVLLWIAMPKEGVMGIICRAIIGALVILNIATWMSMLGG